MTYIVSGGALNSTHSLLLGTLAFNYKKGSTPKRPISKTAQTKTAHSWANHAAEDQNGPQSRPKRPASMSKTAHDSSQNGPWPKRPQSVKNGP